MEWTRAKSDPRLRPTLRLNPPENQENDNDHEDQPQSSGRSITPISAMRPPWQGTQKCQDQNHDQYSSKHVLLPCHESARGAASPRLHRIELLHRDVDRDSYVGIPAVEQVITVVDVGDIDVVGVIPVIRPVFWPWVHQSEPIAAVLEAGISAHNQEGQSVDAESMVRPKVSTETVVRNAVAVVPAALLPAAVIGFPVL